MTIERVRQTVAPDGTMDASGDVIELDRLDAGRLGRRGRRGRLRRRARRCSIAATDEHVGSEVVILRA